jgi:alkylation response protein AidB-like acyl-CoA dehydrogenase
MSDLLYSDIEEDLRASVRGLLTDRSDAATLLARCETDKPYDLDLWRTLAADLGVAGLHVPEERGGQGASIRELAVVAEELGRRVTPVPFLGSAVLATSALLDTDDAALGRLASGEAVGALTVPLATAPGGPFPSSVTAVDGVLTGQVAGAVDAGVAELLVVPATGKDGPELYVVEVSGATGLTVTQSVSLDLTRRIADVEFAGTPARRLAGGDAAAALDRALSIGAGVLASEQVGLAQWCLDETVAYVKDRHQFGRPVGSFQALKHRFAALWLELVSARAAARYAADTLATGDPDAPVAVAVAQSYCGAIAVHAAEECVQLHGGIGMTWEHWAHFYLKRAKSSEIALGTPGKHRANLAQLVELPA